MSLAITKTKSAAPMGLYSATALDARKAAADILIQACDGGKYSVRSRVAISGRGVLSYGNGNYSVTDAALVQLRNRYTIETDF